MILVAIIFPAFAFFLNGKIIQGTVALVFRVVACFTFVFFGIGFLIWLTLAIWSATSLSSHKPKNAIKSFLMK